MPVKIRLARHGKKNKPFYHIVVADSRAPRDGRIIERIGAYNPNTNPAFIELDFDKALNWLQNGAQPTDTCRGILSRQGVLMKKHLLDGVKKNAFSLEEAESRFQKWFQEKQKSAEAQKDKLTRKQAEEQQKLIAAESKVREERAETIAKKNAKLAAKDESADSAEEVAVAEETAEVVETAPEVAEKEEVAEKPVAEAEVTEEEPKVEENASEEKQDESEETEAAKK